MGIWRPFYIPQQPYNQNFLFFFSKKKCHSRRRKFWIFHALNVVVPNGTIFLDKKKKNEPKMILFSLSIYIYWMVLFRTVVVFCLFLTSMSPPTRFFHIRFFRKYWFLVWWSETNIEFCQWKFSHGQFQQRKQQQQQILMMCQNKRKPHHQRHHIRVNDPR